MRWRFVHDGRYDDGSPIIPGGRAPHWGTPSLLQAAAHAPAPRNLHIVCLEEVTPVLTRALWSAPADVALHEFMIKCAHAVLFSSSRVDPVEWAALKAKEQWLRGEITDDDWVEIAANADLDERDLRVMVHDYAIAVAASHMRPVAWAGGTYQVKSGFGWSYSATVHKDHFLLGASRVWLSDFSAVGVEECLLKLVSELGPSSDK